MATDYTLFLIDLDTPQPEGRRGESPRAAFTKYNEAIEQVQADFEEMELTVTGILRVDSGRFIRAPWSGAIDTLERAMFQTTKENAETNVTAVPNGTGRRAAWSIFDRPDATPLLGRQFQVSIDSTTPGAEVIQLDSYNNVPSSQGAPVVHRHTGAPVMALNSYNLDGVFYPGVSFGILGGPTYGPVLAHQNLGDGLTLFSNGGIHAGRVSLSATAGTVFTVGRSTIGALFSFFCNTVPVGSISVSASATSFNQTSDYRIKTDFEEFDGLTTILAIPLVEFEFIHEPGVKYRGCRAHELAEVMPRAVTGEKDAIDPETGAPVYQQVDYSKMTPDLARAVQQLHAIIEAHNEQIAQLADRVAALEASPE